MDAFVLPVNGALARRAEDPNQGKARDAGPTSLSGLVSTLVPVLVVAVPFYILFLLLRRSQRRQYAPRTYLGTLRKEERSPDLPKGLFSWFGAFFSIPDTYVLNHHSLDGYLFLRYLKIAVATCFVGCLIIWPVLFPINITGGRGNKQLDLLSISNVVDEKRYYAHALVSCVFFAFVLYMVTRETLFYINLRQVYLLSPRYANRISSRTVLFTSVPTPYLDETKLRRVFGPAVKNVWICTDCDDIEDLVEERDKVAFRLEGAEVKLVRQANAARLKSLKKSDSGRAEEGNSHAAAAAAAAATSEDPSAESGSVAARWLSQKKRPTHRLKPLIGKKVDTINWSRSELEKLLPKVGDLQEAHRAGKAKYINAVFIEFVSQSAAQDAYQALAHHQPLHMAPRYVGLRPEEIIWKNLKIRWWERVIRLIATTAFIVAMIVFWAIPVTFVGGLSNIQALTDKVKFLRFILDIPPVILGLVTGLLPAVLLAILIALVPIILRLMAKLAGAPSLSQVELMVQNSYFGFQVIQVFLITTLASAAAAAVTKIIKNPSSATDLLAQNLPRASNFYINFFILQGLTLSSGALLQIVGLIVGKILGKILDSTPRKMYKRWSSLAGLGWGSIFPVFTNFFVIAITYSCIAPLVLGFATIGLWLIYFAYRYNLLFVNDANIDTKGLIYPRALQQTLTGVYLAEICLIGLFGIKGAIGPIAIEVVALVVTVLYHLSFNAAISPLLKYLPRTMALEEEAFLAAENGHGEKNGYDSHEEKNGQSHDGLPSDRAMKVLVDSPSPAVLGPAPHKKPNFIAKWLRPDKYCDYSTLRRLVPQTHAGLDYTPEQERNAYYHPAIASQTPLLWIPRDEGGVSRQEVLHTSKVIPITDEGAHLDEKNRIITNQEERPPIHEERMYY